MNKIVLVVGMSLVAGVANAQQAAPLLPEVVLRVTPAELDIISDGLQTQPFGKVLPLINKLREQLVAQQKPAEPKPRASDMEIKPEEKK